MTITKTRGAMKKLGPISLGSKIVRFEFHNADRRFTVHEDLICHTSTLFRARLQKNRKPLLPAPSAEECCVCAEDLDPVLADIAFCATCGQNVHAACIEQWKRTATTCPMCRSAWKSDAPSRTLELDGKLDVEAVQIYLDWLYTGAVRIPASVSRATDAFNVLVLKCWAVAESLGDIAFRNDVVSLFFEEADVQFWKESVEWAFGEGNADEEVRGFVVEVFLAHVDVGWFKNESREWPAQFVGEVAEMMLGVVEGREKRMRFGDIKAVWLREAEEIEVVNGGVEKKDKVVVCRSKESDPLVGLPKVKNKRRAVVEKPRVHVIPRRTERAKETSKQSSQGLQAHAAGFLGSGR